MKAKNKTWVCALGPIRLYKHCASTNRQVLSWHDDNAPQQVEVYDRAAVTSSSQPCLSAFVIMFRSQFGLIVPAEIDIDLANLCSSG